MNYETWVELKFLNVDKKSSKNIGFIIRGGVDLESGLGIERIVTVNGSWIFLVYLGWHLHGLVHPYE